jgi:hypothetical protein
VVQMQTTVIVSAVARRPTNSHNQFCKSKN